MRITGRKWPWQMSRKTKQNATNVVRPSTKESSAHTKRKMGVTEIKVAETRIMEGTGNPSERNLGVSAIIVARAVMKKKTAGRNTQN